MGYILNQINPAYELVSEVIVSSATTSVDFTGLNFDKTDDIILVSSLNNTSSSGTEIFLFVNGNYTNTNYYSQYLYASSTTISAGRSNNTSILYAGANQKSLSMAKIKLTNNGYYTIQSMDSRNYVGSMESQYLFNTSTFTMSSITSLRIYTSNSIGIDSRFQLYKRVAPIVFDYEVTGSATTQVDITGLSIDKTGEYQLVSTVVNGTASGSGISLYTNENTTSTNYYTQSLTVNGSGIGAGRDNANYTIPFEPSSTAFNITNIKLTNNMYYTQQSNLIRNVGTSSLILGKNYITSTFTASELTSLNIRASVSNSIGIGSRFQLIKLK